MPALPDLKPGDAFMLLARLVSYDAQAGAAIRLFTPGMTAQGDITIGAAGETAGTTAAAGSLEVTVAERMVGLARGDVMVNERTGETKVARAVQLLPDGTYLWWSSVARQVVYTTAGWHRVGHVVLD